MKQVRARVNLVIILGIVFILGGCHSNWNERDRTEWILDRVDGYVDDFDLTESQNMKYQDIRTRLEEDLEKSFQDHEVFKENLETTVNRQDVEFSEISDVIKSASDRFPSGMNALLNYMEEFYDLLDETQKQEFIEDIRKRVNRSWW